MAFVYGNDERVPLPIRSASSRRLLGDSKRNNMGQCSSSSSSIRSQAKTQVGEAQNVKPDYHEVEFLESFEVDEETALHDRKKNCKKDPEHSGFIPVEDFNIEHLPEGHRDSLFLDYIMALINLTFRLVVSYVSCDRPDKYPFYQYKGKHIRSFGSGRVLGVERKVTNMDGESCPCPQCEKLAYKDRKKQWGKFEVITAKHVVFDSEESRHTQVDVDYNTDTDRDTCPKLHGVGVWHSNMEIDVSHMYVVSHDRDVCLMLEERLRRHCVLHDKLDNKYWEGYGESNEPVIVCVSHPHGMSKHVSVGEFRGRQEFWPNRLRYTTSTCPGSSGAPIYRLWRGDNNPVLITHHSCYDPDHGCNESGIYGF